MAKRTQTGQLKIEPDAEDENMLAQLVASLQRIEGGLQDILESLEELGAKVDGVRMATVRRDGE